MKHAYLICAHNNFELLKSLVRMLDDPDHDIYIHIDKKSAFDETEFTSLTKHSMVTFTERIRVSWGGTSIIEAELMLLEAALRRGYDYYHMLSGADLPIKTNQQIKAFFEEHKGKEFVAFDVLACETNNFLHRMSLYFFEEPENPVQKKLYQKFNIPLRKLQTRLHVNRIRNSNIEFKKGSAFFDITDGFARWAVDKMRNDSQYRRAFSHVHCGDEVFVQTLLHNSPFRDNRVQDMTRFIDWDKHGDSPETLTMEYWQRLCASPALFARKFNPDVDKAVIDRVVSTFGERENR